MKKILENIIPVTLILTAVTWIVLSGSIVSLVMEGFPASRDDATLIRAQLTKAHINPIDGNMISLPEGYISPACGFLFKYHCTAENCTVWRWSKLAHDIDSWKVAQQYAILGLPAPK